MLSFPHQVPTEPYEVREASHLASVRQTPQGYKLIELRAGYAEIHAGLLLTHWAVVQVVHNSIYLSLRNTTSAVLNTVGRFAQ